MGTVLQFIKSSFFLSLLLLFSLLFQAAFAQDVEEAWVSPFSATGNSDDRAAKMVVDATGTTYVTGTTSEPDGNDNIVTIKYSPEGRVLWASYYDNGRQDVANAIALDANGNIYITGYSENPEGHLDMVTIKYNPSGEQVWVDRYDEPYDIMSFNRRPYEGRALVVDNDTGALYAAGITSNRLHTGIIVIKYALDTGTELWRSKIIHPVTPDGVYFRDYITEAIALDDAGDVYVTGSVYRRQYDMFTAKFQGSDGAVSWQAVYDGEDLIDQARAIAVDNAGGVYITGTSFGDIVTIRYNAADGSEDWVNRYQNRNSTGGVGGSAIAVDDEGGLFVAGQIVSSGDAFNNNGNLGVVKYEAATGDTIWSREYDTDENSWASAITLDRMGGVYITGTDLTTVKFSASDGEQVWAVEPEGYSGILAVGVALDQNGNVVVSGSGTAGSQNSDIITIKYHQEADVCNIPVIAKLYLSPHAVRAGTPAKTTADFGNQVVTGADSVRWTWGDGNTSLAYTDSSTRVTGKHTYQQAGIYRVGLDLSQGCLQVTNEGYEQWQAIYDPDAGAVTGAGWINSPQADFSWMSSAGRAHFAFTVMYRGRNLNTPKGQMLFNIRDEGVFRSHSFSWLVVKGNQAAWRGEGTLNNKGRYGFVAVVSDAGGKGISDIGDRLRIRIWDKEKGNAVVYDNFDVAGDIYDLTGETPNIENGQIIIHHRGELIASLINLAEDAHIPGMEQSHFYNYPNTFSDNTVITFVLEQEEDYTLEVYDFKGSLVKELGTGRAQAGIPCEYELKADGMPEGIYIARLSTSSGAKTLKMILRK